MPTIVIPFRGEDAKQRLPQELRIELAEAMLADVGGQGAAVEATLSDVHETPVLVVNADLPAVTPRDLLALLGSIPPDGIVVAAAADGTTNALGLAAPGLFEPLYGPGSAERSLRLGSRRSRISPTTLTRWATWSGSSRGWARGRAQRSRAFARRRDEGRRPRRRRRRRPVRAGADGDDRAARGDGDRQRRRRPRAARPAHLARPRHAALHPRRPRRRGARLGAGERDLERERDDRAARR